MEITFGKPRKVDTSLLRDAVKADGGADTSQPATTQPTDQPTGQMPGGMGAVAGGPTGSPAGAGMSMDQSPGAMADDLANELSNLSRRVRIIEERYDNVRRKIQLADKSQIETNKKLFKEMKLTMQEVHHMKLDVDDVKEKVKLMILEMKLYATKDQVKVLEKYVNMWAPVNFITSSGAEKLVRDSVEKHMEDLNIKMQQEKFVEETVKNTVDEVMFKRTAELREKIVNTVKEEVDSEKVRKLIGTTIKEAIESEQFNRLITRLVKEKLKE